jgi:hypothetical protein
LGFTGGTDGDVLTSPSGKKIERPSESEMLKLKIGVGINTVLAEREITSQLRAPFAAERMAPGGDSEFTHCG